MRLLVTFVLYEARLQLRSLRFRIACVTYLLLSSLAPLLASEVRHYSEYDYGAGTYLNQTFAVQPFLVVLLAVLVAGNAARFDSATWSVLSSSPMSNVGFLVRRWLAVTLLVVPLTLLPLCLTLGVIVAAEAGPVDPGTVGWPWVLSVLPLAVAASAFWLGLVTVTKSEIAALVLSLYGNGLVLTALNQALKHFSHKIGGYGTWLRTDDFLAWTRWVFSGLGSEGLSSRLATTDAPYDPALALQWLLPRAALGLGLSVFLLTVAAAFLGRTRRDLPPSRVSEDHPLRTYVGVWNRIRQRYLTDAALSRRDRLAMVLGVLAPVAALTFLVIRHDHYLGLGRERYQAEVGDAVPPLPETVLPKAWKIRGELKADASVELEVAASLRNQGQESQGHLAFSLNPELVLSRLKVLRGEAGTVRGRGEVEQVWDRLRVRLTPPLLPGEEITLQLHLSGTPGYRHLPLLGFGQESFAARFERLRKARFSRDVTDLSRSETQLAITPRRIQLRATDLTPVPRYTPWTLTPPPAAMGDPGRQVPDEGFRPKVTLDLDLTVPGSWFLADGCGNTTATSTDGGHDGGPGRLRGRCSAALAGYELRGGPMTQVERAQGGHLTFASLPAHGRQAAMHLKSLSRVVELSQRAWPGIRGLAGSVALEWPPAFGEDLLRPYGYNTPSPPVVRGRLVLVSEALMIYRQPMNLAGVVAEAVTDELVGRRELVAGEQKVFHHLFRSLLFHRMGVGRTSAVVSGRLWDEALSLPILEAETHNYGVWNRRLPAVLMEMESRVGRDTFHAGVEEFLSVESREPGSVRELIGAVEKRAQLSLQRMYEDYFVGNALPILHFEEVRLERRGPRFRVAGRVTNQGTGEALCTVMVKTELDSYKTQLRIDSHSTTPFVLETRTRPHTALLDPDKRCVRYMPLAAPRSYTQVDLVTE